MFKKFVSLFSCVFFFFILLAGPANAERWTLSSGGLSAKTSGSSKSFNPNANSPVTYSCQLILSGEEELTLHTSQSGLEKFVLANFDQITGQNATFIYKKINEKGFKKTLLEENKNVTWAYKGSVKDNFLYRSGKTSQTFNEGFREKNSLAWSQNFNLYEVSNPCFSLIQYLPKGNSPLLLLAKEFNSKFAWYTR